MGEEWDPYKTWVVLLHLVACHPFCLLGLHISHRDRLLFYQIPKFPALYRLSHLPSLPPTFLGQLLCPTQPLVPRVGVPPLCVYFTAVSHLFVLATHFFFFRFCLLCPLVYCLSLQCLTFLWLVQFPIQARCSCDYILTYLCSLGIPESTHRRQRWNSSASVAIQGGWCIWWCSKAKEAKQYFLEDAIGVEQGLWRVPHLDLRSVLLYEQGKN